MAIEYSYLWYVYGINSLSWPVNLETDSEGTSLTQNDEKAYWGKITEIGDSDKDSIEGGPTEWSNKKLEIDGAVMVGWGLEPTTLGRFKMIEIDEILEEDEEEEEEEYEEMSADDVLKNADSLDSMLGTGEDHGDSADPFDLSGACEWCKGFVVPVLVKSPSVMNTLTTKLGDDS